MLFFMGQLMARFIMLFLWIQNVCKLCSLFASAMALKSSESEEVLFSL
jgi:hypothetical protein